MRAITVHEPTRVVPPENAKKTTRTRNTNALIEKDRAIKVFVDIDSSGFLPF